MNADRISFNDMLGFPIVGYHKIYLLCTGHWENPLGPRPFFLIIGRMFGFILLSLVAYLGVASLNGVRYSLNEQELSNVARCLAIFSTVLSAIHKFYTFYDQEQGIYRIGKWMKKVKAANTSPISVTEKILRRYLRLFYYTTLVSPWVMSFMPILHGASAGIQFPFLNEKSKLVLPLIILTYVTLGWEVGYTATTLINALVTFRTEIQLLAEKWSNIKFNPENPNGFGEQLRAYVIEHAELCQIFKDLKKFNNALFGYQVFAATFTTSAFILGCSKDTEFVRNSLSQVVPISFPSLLEFSLLCWLGEEITFGFQQCHRAVHMTDWYVAPLREKTSLTIILEFCKKPVIMTGFTVSTMTLETLLETMKGSFSLYTLLKALS